MHEGLHLIGSDSVGRREPSASAEPSHEGDREYEGNERERGGTKENDKKGTNGNEK